MSHQSARTRSRGAALPRHIATAVLTLGSLGILAGCNDANVVVPLGSATLSVVFPLDPR